MCTKLKNKTAFLFHFLNQERYEKGKKKVWRADAEFMKCKPSLNINLTFQELFSGIGKDFKFDNYILKSLLDIKMYAKCSRHENYFSGVN